VTQSIIATVQDTTIRLYAGEIKKAANGRRRGIGRQARRKVKIQLERRVKTNGEIHVSKATGGFCEDKTEKASNQESLAAIEGRFQHPSTTTPRICREQK